ncbi:MAG: NAD-binding protein, partial [Armatimonadetes bacterium]|nr:NAD-binding protein [Armatimonadota bacterium]
LSEEVQVLRARLFENHVVVCGLGDSGLRFALAFREEGWPVVAIEQDPDAPGVKEARAAGVPVVIGDACSPNALRRAHVQGAKYVIAVCGEESRNAEIAVRVRELARGRSEALTCFVSIRDVEVCDLLRQRELETGYTPAFRLEFFSVAERGARALLGRSQPFAAVETGQQPHVVVVGTGWVGQALIVELAREWARRTCELQAAHSDDNRLHITAIDLEADAKVAFLLAKYSDLAQLVEISPLSVDVQSATFYDGRFLEYRGRAASAVYICLPDEAMALSAAVALKQACYALAINVLVVVRLREKGGLARLFPEGTAAAQAFIGVPMLDEACGTGLLEDALYERLGRAVHEHYLAQTIGQAGERSSRREWDSLDEEYREDSRAHAARVTANLYAHGYRLVERLAWAPGAGRGRATFVTRQEWRESPDIESMAQREHEEWCEHKRKNGWKYGRVFDPKKKTHPDLLPWNCNELSEASKERCRNMI